LPRKLLSLLTSRRGWKKKRRISTLNSSTNADRLFQSFLLRRRRSRSLGPQVGIEGLCKFERWKYQRFMPLLMLLQWLLTSPPAPLVVETAADEVSGHFVLVTSKNSFFYFNGPLP